jgi:hypothetical protein
MMPGALHDASLCDARAITIVRNPRRDASTPQASTEECRNLGAVEHREL